MPFVPKPFLHEPFSPILTATSGAPSALPFSPNARNTSPRGAL